MLCKIGFKTPSLNGRARERKGLNGATTTTATVTIQEENMNHLPMMIIIKGKHSDDIVEMLSVVWLTISN